MRGLIGLIAALGISSIAAAQTSYYECKDEKGRAVFSDRPCDPDAKKLTIDAPASNGLNLGSQGDFSKVRSGNDVRSAEREVKRLEDVIGRLKSTHAKKIRKLESRKSGLKYSGRDQEERKKIRKLISSENSSYYRKLSAASGSLGAARGERSRARATDRHN